MIDNSLLLYIVGAVKNHSHLNLVLSEPCGIGGGGAFSYWTAQDDASFFRVSLSVRIPEPG